MSQRSDQATAYVSYRRILEKDSTEPTLPDPYSTELLLPPRRVSDNPSSQPSEAISPGRVSLATFFEVSFSRTSVSLTISVPKEKKEKKKKRKKKKISQHLMLCLPRPKFYPDNIKVHMATALPHSSFPLIMWPIAQFHPHRSHCTVTLRMSPSKMSTNNFRPCVYVFVYTDTTYIQIYILINNNQYG